MPVIIKLGMTAFVIGGAISLYLANKYPQWGRTDQGFMMPLGIGGAAFVLTTIWGEP